MFSKKFSGPCLILLSLLSLFSVIFYPSLVRTANSQETIIFQDNFDIKNDLSKWNIKSGNWTLPQSRLVGEKYGFDQIGQIEIKDSNWNHFRLEFDAYFILGVDFIIRTRDNQNGYYYFNFRSNAGGRFNTPEIIIQRHEVNNFKEILKTRDFDVPRNFQKNRIIIEQQGTHIFVKLNNNIIFDGYDEGSNIHQGAISLNYATGADGETKTQIDNLIVYQLPAPIPTSTPTPSPSATPIPTPAGKTPLIFIPGFGGSELQTKQEVIWSQPDGHGGIYNRAYANKEKVWVNEDEIPSTNFDDYFDILRLNADGESSQADLEITGTVFSYDALTNYFTQNGYTLNQDFFILTYDWRKDFHQAVNQLNEKIEQIKTATNQPKINMITHSAGGLIARKYISDPDKANNANKLVTIAPPHLGAPKFIEYLRFGGCIIYSVGPFCLSLHPQELKDVLQNFTGGYTLSPNSNYYHFYDGSSSEYPSPYLDQSDIDNNSITGNLNYAQTKDLLTNLGYNTILYNKAESFHLSSEFLSNTNGVDITIIVGSGLSTTGQITEKYKTNIFGKKEKIHDILKINGDETVPLYSASLDNPSRQKSLKGLARILYTNHNHSSIAKSDNVLKTIKNILNNSDQIEPGIQTQPIKLKGKLFKIFSPVNIHAYDQNGNHTGPTSDGNYEANIPGSTYEQFDQDKFIWLPDDQVYTLKFQATDHGSFDFRVDDYLDDSIQKSTYYKEVPIDQSTSGTMAILAGITDTPPIILDTNADGVNDQTIAPTSSVTGTSSHDTTPPVTSHTINATTGNNDWYRSNITLTLSATDNDHGSGVHQIRYRINNSDFLIYQQPVIIDQEGTTVIEYFATDNLGNIADTKTINLNIDKTAPEAIIKYNLLSQNFDITGNDNIEGLVSKSEVTPGNIILTDKAGNTSKIIVSPKDRRRRDEISIITIKYNDQPQITVPKNYLTALVSTDRKGTLKHFDQMAFIDRNKLIYTSYLVNKDQSLLISQSYRSWPQISVKYGLILLTLKTNKGLLFIEY